VLAVVAFHLGVPGVRGGFIGVDIFFVISGYLITGIILRDLEAGRFSLADFYARRIRRILPALVVVLAVTTVLAVLRLYPGELVDYTKSLAAAFFFVSNHYFLSQAQYFGGAAESMPLLHTWSLAIEEQFYLFFPLVLLLAARVVKGRVGLALIIGAIAAASFAVSVILVAVHHERAFFLLVSRAWELSAGALLAVGVLPALRHRLLAEALGFGGLALIAAAVVLYHRAIDFPGILALAPVAAAAAIIYAGSCSGTWVARLLGAAPLVGIGLISYSLYLWHWPLIVFWHLETGGRPDLWAMGLLFAVALALSYLTWRLVETPFRRKGSLVARHPWSATGLAALLVLAFVAPSLMSGGWPLRFTPQAVQTASYLDYDDREVYRRGTCFIDSHVQTDADFDAATCLALADASPNLLIVGDSHAAHLWRGMATALPDVNVLQATASGCKPLVGGRGEKPCVSLMDRVLGDDAMLSRLDAVVLSARWEPKDLPLLEATIARLAGKARHIHVLGPLPIYSSNLPRLLAQAETRGPDFVAAALSPEVRETDRLFAAALAGGPANYVSVYDLLCPADNCITRTPSGVPLQWDREHLTLDGAVTLAGRLEQRGLFR
jgi:peptidoglycan/LPS O-acetylase OafA/YrhL